MISQKRWDSALYFLVGSDNENCAKESPGAVEFFLKITVLMQDSPDHKENRHKTHHHLL